jgi:hypothetical protein
LGRLRAAALAPNKPLGHALSLRRAWIEIVFAEIAGLQ